MKLTELVSTSTLNKSIPEVMTELMSEMPHQRALRLIERHTSFFAFGIVGFTNVDRDAAVLIACMHGLIRVSSEFERE